MSFYRIRPRAGTASQWELVNPVLGEREIGFEVPEGGVGSGNVKMKMGDGVTTWNELPYAILSGIAPEDIVHNGETNDPNKIVGADAFYSLSQNVATLDTEVDTLTDSLKPRNIKDTVRLNDSYFDSTASQWGASRVGNVVSIWFNLKLGTSGFGETDVLFSNLPKAYSPMYVLVKDSSRLSNAGLCLLYDTELKGYYLDSTMIEQWDYLLGSVTYITSE